MKRVIFYEAEQLKKLQRKAYAVEAIIYLLLFLSPLVGFIYLYNLFHTLTAALIALLIPCVMIVSAIGDFLAYHITRKIFSKFYPACTVLKEYFEDFEVGDHVYCAFLDYKTTFLLAPRSFLKDKAVVDRRKIEEEIAAFLFGYKDTCGFIYLN